jgi:hypothetical protein
MRQYGTPRSSRTPGGDPVKYVLAVLAIGVGAAAVVAGEADDSPGLQLLGLVLIVGAVTLGVRIARRRGRRVSKRRPTRR